MREKNKNRRVRRDYGKFGWQHGDIKVTRKYGERQVSVRVGGTGGQLM